MGQQQLRREIREQRAAGGRIRPGQLEQQLNGDLKPVERIGLPGGGRPDLLRRAAQCVFEQGQEQLVLAVEVLIEAPQ